MYTVTEFSPWTALGGGVLIGLAALLLLAANGRIAGISGIVGHIATSRGHERHWRLAFVVGLLAGASGYLILVADLASIQAQVSLPLMLLAGFIVGVGTRLGNGCTSGHGVCGIGRLSARSMVATASFMFVAGLTVFVLRHVAEV